MKWFKFFSFLLVLNLSCKSQPTRNLQSEVVLINTGVNNRIGIANEIAIIAGLNPKVVAVDLQFSTLMEPYHDSLLMVALQRCNKLVMAVEINNYTARDDYNYNELTGTLPKFLGNAKVGFINVVLEEDDLETLKRFSIYEKVNGQIVYNLAVQAAMEFDSLKTVSFINRNLRITDVPYKGGENMFKTFSVEDVMNRRVTQNDIKGKIVLFGYLGPYKGYSGPLLNDDKFFSPLNERGNPPEPDMYGVVYLANVIDHILTK